MGSVTPSNYYVDDSKSINHACNSKSIDPARSNFPSLSNSVASDPSPSVSDSSYPEARSAAIVTC